MTYGVLVVHLGVLNVPAFNCAGARGSGATDNRIVGLRPTLSCSGSQILAKNAWVPRGDSQERDRWPLGRATTLLPVAKSVNANTHGASKACLRQADKPTERGDIVA